MEQLLALKVWAVLIAAPCMACWLIGDFFGARRMRQLHEQFDVGSLFEWPAQMDHASLPPIASEQDYASSVPRAPRGQPAASRAAGPRAPFEFAGMHSADVPALADLHAHTASIRASERLWDDFQDLEAGSVLSLADEEALQRYRASIETLVHTPRAEASSEKSHDPKEALPEEALPSEAIPSDDHHLTVNLA
ncbi:MAG: hypothetical protein AAFR88_04360 [Pseudomonadota bacterium]